MTNKQWIYELDILKVIAIIFVLASHGSGIIPCSTELRPYISYLGSIGVIFFFFVSGFLLSNVKLNTVHDLLNHIKKRFIRIVPLYWVTLALTVLLTLWGVYTGYWIKNLSLSNVFVHATFLQSFFPSMDIPPLWFVGALFVYEAIYIVTKALFKNIIYFSIIIIGIYCIIVALSAIADLIVNISGSYMFFFTGIFIGYLWHSAPIKPQLMNQPPHPIIVKLSYASYCAYLFHLLIMDQIGKWFNGMYLSNYTLYIVIALPIVFMIAYFIQCGYDTLLKVDLGQLTKKINSYAQDGDNR